ncbi:hypothetical protein J25TS5_54860 [Paenibacillus faecis]|nr:hypothetical protein J25TS5_54860 [Paenibacillus faecis]
MGAGSSEAWIDTNYWGQRKPECGKSSRTHINNHIIDGVFNLGGSVEFKFRYATKLDKQEMPGTFLLVVIA